jgi:hypothetical protein
VCLGCISTGQVGLDHKFDYSLRLPLSSGLTPLILFCIFGTQRDVMCIWKFWAYRLIGKQPQFTPRTSNEGQTLSNTSAPSTGANELHVIHTLKGATREMHQTDGKAHRVSSSAGGRESISDPLGLMTVKHSTAPSDLSGHLDHDLESALPETGSKCSRPGPSLAMPDLPYMPETPNLSASATMSPRQAQLYSSATAISSQGLVSSQGHSGTRSLISSQNTISQSDPPFIVVTDGFGAMFGAQVPSSVREGTVGRQIISHQERRRWLTAHERRHPHTGDSREPRKSVGLPPPPRSPRQSNARPTSAGGNTMFAGKEGGAPGLGPSNLTVAPAPVAASWNWDSPFRVVGSPSVLEMRSKDTSDGGTISRGDSELGIEMEEKVKTPSNRSFERGHAEQESQGKEGSRDSWLSKNSRMSVTSDRTFG